MKKTFRSLAAVLGLGLMVSAENASATDYLVTLGNSSGSLENIQVVEGDRFLVDFAANRSYYCEGIPVSNNTNFDMSTGIDQLDAGGNVVSTLNGREIGTIPPPVTGDVGDSGDNRLSLIPTVTARYRFTVSSAALGGELVKFRCFATTLFSGYNTVANDFNYLELTNIGNATCNALVSLVDNSGTPIVTNEALSVAAQRRADYDVHSKVGAAKFGFVRITHDCPLGTLQGLVSQYDLASTGGSFSLTASLPLTTFDQRQ